MKLKISNLGIYDPIKDDLEDALTNLQSAKSTLTRPPASFSQSGYMSSVPSKISDLIRKVTNLSNAASRIDQKYKDYILDKKTKFNNLDDCKLNERIGLSEQFQNSSQKYNVMGEIFIDENGLLSFSAIAGAAGIKSALPNNGAGVSNDNGNSSSTETPKDSKSIKDSKEHPDTMNIEIDEPAEPAAPSGGTNIPGVHSPGTMDRTYQAQAYNLSPEEYKVLCATVYAEAAEGNEYTYSDAMGVTSSILNRVEAGNYGGSTITAVVLLE